MKKTVIAFGFLFLVFSLSSFDFHKFYIALFQVQFVPEKKRLQITSRIFIDDLNQAIEKKYHKKTSLGIGTDSPEDIQLLTRYFAENLVFKVNGRTEILTFLSSEVEEDVLVSYLSIPKIAKIQQLNIQNTILTDWNTEQQNIMHFNIGESKKSLHFTPTSANQMLKF